MVEQGTHNPQVLGSSPGGPTNYMKPTNPSTKKCLTCGGSRMLIGSGGEYFEPLKQRRWICAAAACPSHRTRKPVVRKFKRIEVSNDALPFKPNPTPNGTISALVHNQQLRLERYAQYAGIR